MLSIAKQIKKQLDNDTSSTYRRKPILVLCRKREEAEIVFDELKRRLRDVTKIVLVADEQDFADQEGQLSKQTVLVLSDELKLCPISLPF